MLSQFSALHAIAAQRGDGLRPELLRLLDEQRRQAEARSFLSDGDTPPEGVVRFPSAIAEDRAVLHHAMATDLRSQDD
jgi:hypothetical protein